MPVNLPHWPIAPALGETTADNGRLAAGLRIVEAEQPGRVAPVPVLLPRVLVDVLAGGDAIAVLPRLDGVSMCRRAARLVGADRIAARRFFPQHLRREGAGRGERQRRAYLRCLFGLATRKPGTESHLGDPPAGPAKSHLEGLETGRLDHEEQGSRAGIADAPAGCGGLISADGRVGKHRHRGFLYCRGAHRAHTVACYALSGGVRHIAPHRPKSHRPAGT